MEALKDCQKFIATASWPRLVEMALSSVTVFLAFNYIRKTGVKRTFGNLVLGALNTIPGAKGAVKGEISKEVDKAVEEMFKPKTEAAKKIPRYIALPKKGINKENLLQAMKDIQQEDVHAEDGRVWAYVYCMSKEDEAFNDFVKKAHNMFMHENALNPTAFPSLQRFENEVVSMVSRMLGGDEHARGSMTTGGTESILLAVKTYRDRAKELYGITEPEMIMPITAHAAFMKAAHYFQVKPVCVPIGSDYRADVDAMRKAINKNTILLIGSAPQYAHGVVDPIEELGRLAKQHNLPLHVDSCIGGFMLPWVKKLGYEVPNFDLSVDGVTSISADIHKYGYGPKGASCVVFKDESIRKYQFFVYSEWPGGLFASPTMLGTRGGGTIAASWAVLTSMGEDGYTKVAASVMETAKILERGINNIPGLYILGSPHMSILSFSSGELNILAVADAMEKEFGWKIERQQKPSCLHLTVMPQHVPVCQQFLKDLQQAVEGTAAMYGMVAKIPAPELVDEFLNQFMSKVYT